MKRTKHLILTFVLILLLAAVAVVSASAEGDVTIVDSGTCGSNLTWTFDSAGTLTISGNGYMNAYSATQDNGIWRTTAPWGKYYKTMQAVVLEDSVTSIGKCAFDGCTSLTSVTIPDSVTSIGSWAFDGCTSLTSVTIPNSVKSIGKSAFSDCRSLTSVTIPDGVTSIGDSTFDCCTSLTSVTIPDSVTSIGNYAFYNCQSLTSVTIPDSVTSIGNYAFYNCQSLTSVTIGDSVTSIGYEAFRDCTALKNVNISDVAVWCGIDFYYSSYSNPLGYAKNLYLNGELVNALTIPDSVTSIGNWAFDGCTSLTSVTIPDSVTSIGSWAFDGCTSLTSVTIPNSVKSIGKSAFSDCRSLTSVTIPDGVTSIGDSTFDCCTSLTSVTIPDSVTSIGYRTFYNCTSLTSITIPDSVTGIGRYAFYRCSSLTSVTIPDSVKGIGEDAFYNCTSLTSVTIGNSVTSIGKWTFGGCTALESVTIPDSVTSIDRYAFDYCSSLKDVFYTGSQEQWTKISIDSDNVPLIKATKHYNHIPEDRFGDYGYVRLEFRYADTGALIDNHEHLADAQVGMNYKTYYNSHPYVSADKGIAYLPVQNFPLVYVSASWQSAFGGPEYSLKTTNPIYAVAGDTVKLYLSANGNGSVVSPRTRQSYSGNSVNNMFIQSHVDSWDSVKQMMQKNSFYYNSAFEDSKLFLAHLWRGVEDTSKLINLKISGYNLFVNQYEAYLADILLQFTEQDLLSKIGEKVSNVMDGYQTAFKFFKNSFKTTAEWNNDVTKEVKVEISNFFKFDDYKPSLEATQAFQQWAQDPSKVKSFFGGLLNTVCDNASFINDICDKVTTALDVIESIRKVYNAYVLTQAYRDVTEEFYQIMLDAARSTSSIDAAAGRKLRNAVYSAKNTSSQTNADVFNAIYTASWETSQNAYNMTMEIFKPAMYGKAAEILGIKNLGTFGAVAFASSIGVAAGNFIGHTGDLSEKYLLMSKLAPVEYGLHKAVTDRYTALIADRSMENAINYDFAYRLLQQTNNYLYQANYDFCKKSPYNLKDEMTLCKSYMTQWTAISCHDSEAFPVNYKAITVRCPVDVYVYLNNDFLVTSVVNEQIEEFDPNITVLVSEGEKTIIYPAREEYTVKIVAREAGTMDYSVSELNEDYAVAREVETYDIPLTQGQEFVDVIPNESGVEKTEYALTTNEEPIAIDYDSKDNCAGAHTFGDWSETETYRTRVCTVCGYSETETLHKTHDTPMEVYSVMPTCNTPGHTVMICPGCGEQLADGKDYPKLGHDYIDEIVLPTCTQQGYTKTICPDCGAVKADHSYVDALGHEKDENTIVTVDATCKNAGSLTYTCVRCNETITETIPATGVHTPGDPVKENEVAATYDVGGSYDEVVYCSVCHDELSRKTVATEPLTHTHNYVAETTTAPTCTADGETTYTCSICGDTYTEPIPATGEHVDADNDGYCDTCEEMMQGGDHCKFCGKIHGGLFGWLVKIFHSIFAIFKR